MAKVKISFGKITGLSVLVIGLALAVAQSQMAQNFQGKAWFFGPRISPIPMITPSPSPIITKATFKPKTVTKSPASSPVVPPPVY